MNLGNLFNSIKSTVGGLFKPPANQPPPKQVQVRPGVKGTVQQVPPFLQNISNAIKGAGITLNPIRAVQNMLPKPIQSPIPNPVRSQPQQLQASPPRPTITTPPMQPQIKAPTITPTQDKSTEAIRFIRQYNPEYKGTDDQLRKLYSQYGDKILYNAQQNKRAQEQVKQSVRPTVTQIPKFDPPPTPVQQVIQKHFGKKAGDAAFVAYSESGYRPDAINPANNDGSEDRGLFQINSNTFNQYLAVPQLRKKMVSYGINSYDDMFDPDKNAFMGKLIYDRQGWGAWYGPLRFGVKMPIR